MSKTEKLDIVLDRTVLQSWIQPHHLEDAALSRYRAVFAKHPARLVVIRNFLLAEVAERLSTFLATEAVFQREYGLYSSEAAVPEKQFLAAAPSDRFFRMGKLVGTDPQFFMSRNALTYIQFRQAFQRTEFRTFFERVSGLKLRASDDFGSHRMCAGDFLRVHSDANRNRQLALVLYLSSQWQSDFGGVLHVIDQAGNQTEIKPEYNMVVAFDVLANSEHLVAPIRTGTRFSIGGWYKRPDE